MAAQSVHPIKVFYCYAHEDGDLRERLERHLIPLRQRRDITGWFDLDIQAGLDWKRESEAHLDNADIILLLLSANFMASRYGETVEITHALERHRAGTTRVIPILLKPVDWEITPFGTLSPLPTNGKPVTAWANQEEAFLDIAQGINRVVRAMLLQQDISYEDENILSFHRGPLTGQRVGGKYLLGELLGEGGYGQVYKAQHLQLERTQAVKILLDRHFQKSEFRERFKREARIVAALNHPNIIHVDDFDVEPARAYLVMPFIEGGTLQDILEKQRLPLGLEQIIFYLEHICIALDYAHAHGVVHLDLKPLNLLVRSDGGLLLADFGLAHLMKQGAVEGGASLFAGSPHYMAPEHIQGREERRSDLFSLGVIVYRMLTGRLPFEGSSIEDIQRKIQREWPIAIRTFRPELPQGIEDVVTKALAKQPELRYQTANGLLDAFKGALNSSESALPGEIDSSHNIPSAVNPPASTVLTATNPATPRQSNQFSPTIQISIPSFPITPLPLRPNAKVIAKPPKRASFVQLGLAGLMIMSLASGIFWFITHHTSSPGTAHTSSTGIAHASPTAHTSPIGIITEFPLPLIGGAEGGSAGAITKGPDGNLWFTEDLDQIGRISPSGHITEFSIHSLDAQSKDVFIPFDITAGPDGNLWFTDNESDLNANHVGSQIGCISPNGKVSLFPLSDSQISLGAITAGSDGNLWFTDFNFTTTTDQIGRMSPSGQVTEFPLTGFEGTNDSIVSGPDGNLWFSELDGIGRISLSGQITHFSLPGSNAEAWGITVGPDGNLWFSETMENKSITAIIGYDIGRMSLSGKVTEFSLPGPHIEPTTITAGPDGNLWFIESITSKDNSLSIGNEIGSISPSGHITEFPLTEISNGNDTYGGITAGPDGNLWFTKNVFLGDGQIGRITSGK